MGQDPRSERTFEVFALVVLPTLYLLGIFSFIRIVECGAEDYRYGMAINRIRHYYQEVAGDQARLFLLSGHDDGRGVFGNAAVPTDGRTQLFTFATVVAVINSVIGGSTIAFAASVFFEAPLSVTAGTGAAAGLVSAAVLLRHADRLLKKRTATTQPMFPSKAPQIPESRGDDGADGAEITGGR